MKPLQQPPNQFLINSTHQLLEHHSSCLSNNDSTEAFLSTVVSNKLYTPEESHYPSSKPDFSALACQSDHYNANDHLKIM